MNRLFMEEDDEAKTEPTSLQKAASYISDVDDKYAKPVRDNKFLKSQTVNNSSIVARARKSVMQFPIYITETLRINEAQIIAGLFERVYLTLVQAVIAQHPVISEEEANELSFLKQFHTNIKESADIDIISYKERAINEYYTPIDEIDSMMQDAIFYQENITPNVTVTFRRIPSIVKDINTENARLANEPLIGLTYLKESNEKAGKSTTTKTEREWEMHTEDYVRKMADKMGKDPDQFIKDVKKGKYSNLMYDEETGKYKKLTAGVKVTTTETPGATRGADAPKLLRDTDIKKINGMLPLTLEATFRVKTAAGKDDYEISYVLGVKSILHPIRVQDLAEELRDLVNGNVKTLRKVRYKSGEINFLDYVFNLSQLKKDASKSINGNKRWITTLKRLSDYERMNGSLLKTPASLLNNGSVPIPNGTLILAESDVSTLLNSTGIDLNKVSNVKRLAKSLFLIGFAIVDSAAGSMKVLFPDSQNSWDVESLAAIDADIQKTDNSALMKELARKING